MPSPFPFSHVINIACQNDEPGDFFHDGAAWISSGFFFLSHISIAKNIGKEFPGAFEMSGINLIHNIDLLGKSCLSNLSNTCVS